MKLEGQCGTCHRTFLLSQIGPESDAPGRCPFCGAYFARHYSSLLVESVAEAEEASGRFVRALQRLQDIESGFDIDMDELLRTLSDQVRSTERHSAAT